MAKKTHFRPGDKVRDIYTGDICEVVRSYWQFYDGGDTSDWTVELKPITQGPPTPWNKSCNLELVK